MQIILMLQKGQISKATEMNPVLYIQPFSTCCLASNRRRSDHGLWRQIQQRKWDTNQHKTQTGDWQCRKADMQSHGWGILPKISELYTAPSTQVLPCSHSHHNQPTSSNQSTRNNLTSYLGSSTPYKTLPSAQQSSLCVRIEVACPLTDILFQTQTNFTQNLQILQFSTYLSRVSWGALLPPALLLTLLFLLAVMVISAF